MADGELELLSGYLVVGAILFGLGIIGFLSRRNMITVFLAAEIMLQGISLSLTAWGRYYNDFGGQMLVLMIIAVAACEAAIALGMVLMLYQRKGSLDIFLWQNLREESVTPQVDRELPEMMPEKPPAWPTLTPAGIAPDVPREETEYRPHV